MHFHVPAKYLIFIFLDLVHYSQIFTEKKKIFILKSRTQIQIKTTITVTTETFTLLFAWNQLYFD